MNDATHAYIGINKEGKCRAATVDDGEKDVAKFVAKLIRDGYTVERVTIEEARLRLSAGYAKTTP